MMHGRRCATLGWRAVAAAVARNVEVPGSSSSTVGVNLLNSAQLWESRLAVWPLLNCFAQLNHFSCCAKVDLPPPREIIVEYEERPENTDYFIKLADEIENANPELMVTGNPDDMQPRDGSFEVTSGQNVLFSKLQANRLPRLEDVLRALEKLPTEELSCELGESNRTATA